MLENIRNIFRIPDLRKRVLFTLGILAVYRLGSQIPTPGVNLKLLAQFFDQQAGSALGLVDLFSGGNLRRLTIFALGIDGLNQNTKIGGSLIVMAIGGGAVLTPLMGWISQTQHSIAEAYMVPLLCYCGIALYSFVGVRMKRRESFAGENA